MTAPSPPRKTAWFLGPPRWSAEEDGLSHPHHQTGCPRSGKRSGKNFFFQGQGIVREF